MKFLALLIFATSAFAESYVCTGDTAQEVLIFKVMQIKEVKKFGKEAVRGITLESLDRELCEHYVSIDAEEDAYPIVAAQKDISALKTSLSVWDGNWGYDLKVPNKVFENKLKAGEKFKMTYKFTYNDIDEAEVTRILDCVKK